jgi:hypothetical protein
MSDGEGDAALREQRDAAHRRRCCSQTHHVVRFVVGKLNASVDFVYLE